MEFDENGLSDEELNLYQKNKKNTNNIINETCCEYEEIIFNRPFFYVVTYSDLFDNYDILVIGKIENVEL